MSRSRSVAERQCSDCNYRGGDFDKIEKPYPDPKAETGTIPVHVGHACPECGSRFQ